MKQYFNFEDIKGNSAEEERQKWFYAINKYEKANNYNLESPTINKMIEFLNTRGEYEKNWLNIEYKHGRWRVTILKDQQATMFANTELIDALWEAVKSIL